MAKAESRKRKWGAKWEGQRSKDERRGQKVEVRKEGARSGELAAASQWTPKREHPTSNIQLSTTITG
jgi:hypothetical protein